MVYNVNVEDLLRWRHDDEEVGELSKKFVCGFTMLGPDSARWLYSKNIISEASNAATIEKQPNKGYEDYNSTFLEVVNYFCITALFSLSIQF